MNRELKNRENRLRYKAEQKGLCIKKEYYRINNERLSGYLISRYGSSFVLTGDRHWNHLISIEEAEEFVSGY